MRETVDEKARGRHGDAGTRALGPRVVNDKSTRARPVDSPLDPSIRLLVEIPAVPWTKTRISPLTKSRRRTRERRIELGWLPDHMAGKRVVGLYMRPERVDGSELTDRSERSLDRSERPQDDPEQRHCHEGGVAALQQVPGPQDGSDGPPAARRSLDGPRGSRPSRAVSDRRRDSRGGPEPLAEPLAIPLGTLLDLWHGKPSRTTEWRSRQAPGQTSLHGGCSWKSGFRLEAGDLRLRAEVQARADVGKTRLEVVIPKSDVVVFKKAVGELLRMSDVTVGHSGANLTPAGSYRKATPIHKCPICRGYEPTAWDRHRGHNQVPSCSKNDLGMVCCIAESNGSIATTQKGAFVHLPERLLKRVRIAGPGASNVTARAVSTGLSAGIGDRRRRLRR